MKKIQYIKYRFENAVATITLARPQVGNALHIQLIEELTEAFLQAAQDEKVRMVCLKGEGKHFCTGADLRWMSDINHQNIMQESIHMARLFKTIHELPKPTVAYVQGKCYGGGIGLAAACNFVFAEPSASFAFNEVKLGLIPATIAPYVLERTGSVKSRQLMITAQEFSAEKAIYINLVDELIPQELLRERLVLLLKDILKGGPEAIASVKFLLRILEQPQIHNDIEHITASFIAQARLSEEGLEGMNAFLQKRKPVWSNVED